eukprot:scaffold38151_cov36-Phaeocystis_antarctica.AAC.1
MSVRGPGAGGSQRYAPASRALQWNRRRPRLAWPARVPSRLRVGQCQWHSGAVSAAPPMIASQAAQGRHLESFRHEIVMVARPCAQQTTAGPEAY